MQHGASSKLSVFKRRRVSAHINSGGHAVLLTVGCVHLHSLFFQVYVAYTFRLGTQDKKQQSQNYILFLKHSFGHSKNAVRIQGPRLFCFLRLHLT